MAVGSGNEGSRPVANASDDLEALYREHRALALVAQHTDNAAVVTDKHGRIEWVNAGFERITGYTLEEIQGKKPGSFLQGEMSDPSVVAEMSRGFREARGFDVEVVNYSKAGVPYWIAIECRPIFDERGELERFIAIERDITSTKEHDRSLRLLKAAVDNVGEVMLTLNCLRGIVDANAAAEHRLEYDRDTLLSLQMSIIDSRLRGTDWLARWAKLRAQRRISYRTVLRTRSGQLIQAQIAMTLVEIDGKRFAAVFVRDITSEVIMSQKLFAERALLRAVLEGVPYEVYWKDLENRYLGCNGAFAERAGVPHPDAIVGRSDDVLGGLTRPGPELPTDDELMNSGESCLHSVETEAHAGGRTRSIETSRIPLRNECGVFGLLGLRADVTERRELETQLAHSQQLESIGQLAAGIAHEINTPAQYVLDNSCFVQRTFEVLNPLLARVQKTLAGLVDGEEVVDDARALRADFEEADFDYLCEEVPTAIDEAISGIERVRHIVLSMKEFSHPGSEGKEPADLNRAIESTVTVATNEWKYVADVDFDLDEDLPLVACYPAELNQVVLNIVVNAAHAIRDVIGPGEKGKITIRTRQLEDGDSVEVRIQDSGSGIPVAVQDRIFDPFFTTKEVGCGTGQGLAIARGVIVQKHGGTLDFETEIGVGTAFVIRLPLVPQEDEAALDAF